MTLSSKKIKQVFQLVEKGDLDKLESFLSTIPNVQDIIDDDGENILHVAARFGHLSIICHFIENHKMNPTLRDKYGRNILHFSVAKGHLSLVQYLLEKQSMSISITDNNGCNVLHYATIHGHLEVLKYLLEVHQMNTMTYTKFGNTILHYASMYGHLSILQYLIDERQMSVNSSNKKGEKAIDLVCQKAKKGFVNYFHQQAILNFLKSKQHSKSSSSGASSPCNLDCTRTEENKPLTLSDVSQRVAEFSLNISESFGVPLPLYMFYCKYRLNVLDREIARLFNELSAHNSHSEVKTAIDVTQRSRSEFVSCILQSVQSLSNHTTHCFDLKYDYDSVESNLNNSLFLALYNQTCKECASDAELITLQNLPTLLKSFSHDIYFIAISSPSNKNIKKMLHSLREYASVEEVLQQQKLALILTLEEYKSQVINHPNLHFTEKLTRVQRLARILEQDLLLEETMTTTTREDHLKHGLEDDLLVNPEVTEIIV